MRVGPRPVLSRQLSSGGAEDESLSVSVSVSVSGARQWCDGRSATCAPSQRGDGLLDAGGGGAGWGGCGYCLSRKPRVGTGTVGAGVAALTGGRRRRNHN